MTSKREPYWRNRRVLVTGHEGFLGSWLTKALLSYGAKIVGVDKVKNRPISILNGLRKDIACVEGNITSLKLVKNIIEEYEPQCIFHLAAEAIVVEANKNPVRTFKSNIEGSWNILEASRDKKFIETIVVASSDKAYGESDKLPYKEDAPLSGNHPYDVSKSCADLLAHTYFRTYNSPVCVTRCGNIFGPGDLHFSRIVPDTIRSALQNKTFLIRSDGTFTRDYIYVEDIVKGYILLAEKLQESRLYGQAFNFGNEKPISVLELVRIIYKLAGRQPEYEILNEAKHEIGDQYLSAKKAKKTLGWEPKYTLQESLRITIDWYQEFLSDDNASR